MYIAYVYINSFLTQGEIMKKLITLMIVTMLAITTIGYTQKVEVREECTMEQIMNNLPDDVQNELKRIQNEIKALDGVSEKAMEQKREQLRDNAKQLQNNAIDELPEKTREQVRELVKDMENKIQERKMEVKELQNK